MYEFVQVGDRQIPVHYHGLYEPVKYANPREAQTFHFAGFDFRVERPTSSGPIEEWFLVFDAILPNPEGYAYLSYHTFREYPHPCTKQWAAAWLIAHWWEHFMHNCACQVDDAKPSGFRQAFIGTLLYLESADLETERARV